MALDMSIYTCALSSTPQVSVCFYCGTTLISYYGFITTSSEFWFLFLLRIDLAIWSLWQFRDLERSVFSWFSKEYCGCFDEDYIKPNSNIALGKRISEYYTSEYRNKTDLSMLGFLSSTSLKTSLDYSLKRRHHFMHHLFSHFVVHKLLFVAIWIGLLYFFLQKLCCWYLRLPFLYISKGEEGNISNISAFLHLLQSIIDKRHSINSLEIVTNGWIDYFKLWCIYRMKY